MAAPTDNPQIIKMAPRFVCTWESREAYDLQAAVQRLSQHGTYNEFLHMDDYVRPYFDFDRQEDHEPTPDEVQAARKDFSNGLIAFAQRFRDTYADVHKLNSAQLPSYDEWFDFAITACHRKVKAKLWKISYHAVMPHVRVKVRDMPIWNAVAGLRMEKEFFDASVYPGPKSEPNWTRKFRAINQGKPGDVQAASLVPVAIQRPLGDVQEYLEVPDPTRPLADHLVQNVADARFELFMQEDKVQEFYAPSIKALPGVPVGGATCGLEPLQFVVDKLPSELARTYYGGWWFTIAAICRVCASSGISPKHATELCHSFSKKAEDKYDEAGTNAEVRKWLGTSSTGPSLAYLLSKLCIEERVEISNMMSATEECLFVEIPEVQQAANAPKPSLQWFVDPSISTADRNTAMLTLGERMNMMTFGEAKKEFEQVHVKIYKGGMYSIIEPDGEVLLVGRDKMMDVYLHLMYRYPVKGKKGKVTWHTEPFLKKWLRTPNIKVAMKIDFAPPPIPVVVGTFNTFNGFPIAHCVPTPSDLANPTTKQARCLELYLEQLLVLTSYNAEHQQYLDARFCDIFQFPGRKCPRALIFRGPMGAGKNIILAKLLKPILGHYYRQMQSMDRLLGRFSNAFVDTLLLVLDEVEIRDSVKFIEAFKDLVTEETRPYEKKCVDEVVVRNLARIVITTNNDNCMVIPEGNRRVEVFDVAPDKIDDAEYFREMADLFKDPECQRFMYDYFCTKDISGYDFTNKKTLVVTPALKDMMGLNLNIHVRFAGELCWSMRNDIILAMSGATKNWIVEPHVKMISPGIFRAKSSWLYTKFHDVEEMKSMHIRAPKEILGSKAFGTRMGDVEGVIKSSIGKARLAAFDFDVRAIWNYCAQHGYVIADDFKLPHEQGYCEFQEKDL